LKTLIITNKILAYRHDFYDLLGEKVDLSVVQYGTSNYSGVYRNIRLKRVSFAGFYYIKGLNSVIRINEFNSIICIFDLRFLNLYVFLFSNYRKKVLLWGIGISSQNGLKEKKYLDKIRILIANKATGLIVYSKEVAHIYKKLNYEKPVYVATNSARVTSPTSHNFDFKNNLNFLFVGSLDKRKGIDVFLHAYAAFIENLPQITSKINIIGDGGEKFSLMELVNILNIADRVVFHGRINDTATLSEFYSVSIMSFSINQAGLSVLQSLGNGVPFLSSVDAITGGELFNVIDKKTGFLLQSRTNKDKSKEILTLLNLIKSQPEILISMREDCLSHYKNNASLKNMCNVFLNAISNVQN
jgi:glycosyltransferase involved in cell wall biosynthesis